ncbi:hypothetical protein XFF6990_360030 [Xanthomonas citri pv. fuscans]|nr:hypothetical protein XFF6990_360030 [Xanthomonas citri pv. fuscans]
MMPANLHALGRRAVRGVARIASRQALPRWRRQMESGALSAATNLDYFPGAGGPDQARR